MVSRNLEALTRTVGFKTLCMVANYGKQRPICLRNNLLDVQWFKEISLFPITIESPNSHCFKASSF